MKKNDALLEFHKELNDQLYKLEMKTDFPNQFYQSFLSGENTLYQKNITEIKTFHEDWIGTIESYFLSIDKVTRNAKSGLRYHQEIVAIEKAKKTGSDSVRHLASHTHLLKEIRGGNVIPKRIQVTQSEIDLAIYENRFVKTLIDRLFEFVIRRHRIIQDNIESFESKHFNLKSSFEIHDSKVEIDVDVNIKDLLEFDKSGNSNYELLKRVNNLLRLINGLKSSVFMEELKNSKPVKPPILKTSVLLKNTDYRNCYNLWLYLDRYYTLDFDIDVKEKNLPFDKYYLRNTYQTALMAFSTVHANQEALTDYYRFIDAKSYTKKSPKIVKKHLKDLTDKAEPEVLEDTTISQYYLEESMKVFKDNIKKHAHDSSTYDVALKKALRDTINISNTLYSSYFDLAETKDDIDLFFERMVKEDTKQQLEKAKEKAKIIKLIRETKEVDFNNILRQEKRNLKAIGKLEKNWMKELKSNALDIAEKRGIEERIKIERQNLAKNQAILTDNLKYVSEQKQALLDAQKEFKEKAKENAEKIKEEEKHLIEIEKKKAKVLYNKELREIRKKALEKSKKVAAQIRKKKQEMKAKLLLEERKLKKRARQAVMQEKQNIIKKQKEKLKKEKDKLKNIK